MARFPLVACLGLLMATGGPAFAQTLSAVPPELPNPLLDSAALGADPAASGIEEGPALRILGTRVAGQLTGADSPNDTAARWDVYGTDLGHMFWHRDALYMVFGDTFGPRGMGGRNWRSNTMALVADPDPLNGLPFEAMIAGPDGAAKELLAARRVPGEEKTIIPTHGVSIEDRMYLHYMSVERWGDRGGVWTVGHSGLAYSDDDGRSWERPVEAVWPRGTGFEQVAFAVDGDFLYSLGIPEGRFGGVRLRRVAPAEILVREAYEYWDGAAWAGEPASGATIVPAPVGELSVAWSEPHGAWLMMYLDEERRAVMLRTAAALTGPWGPAQPVATAADHPGLYAPYIVPGAQIDGDLYYTMSLWGPYNVFLMHTSLEPAAPAVAAAD